MAYCTAKQINCHLSRRKLLPPMKEQTDWLPELLWPPAIDFAPLFLAGAHTCRRLITFYCVLFSMIHCTWQANCIRLFIPATCPLQLTRLGRDNCLAVYIQSLSLEQTRRKIISAALCSFQRRRLRPNRRLKSLRACASSWPRAHKSRIFDWP